MLLTEAYLRLMTEVRGPGRAALDGCGGVMSPIVSFTGLSRLEHLWGSLRSKRGSGGGGADQIMFRVAGGER